MIEFLWQQLGELWGYVVTNYDPLWDTLDVAMVAFGIYWLLLLIKGTRAVQMLMGLLILLSASITSQLFELSTVSWIMDRFLSSAVLIVIILFQHDIRRALARVGRGFFPAVTAGQEVQILEEIVRACSALAQKRVGALIVLERENNLEDQFEAGVVLDAAVTKELLTSIFLPYSPLHDGAVLIENGRVAFAGCVLPLTLRQDLPEGLGTRHRAAVGITEESDAVVVVVSEETARISVVVGGEMQLGLDPPQLRGVLRDLLTGGGREAAPTTETVARGQTDDESARASEAASIRTGG